MSRANLLTCRHNVTSLARDIMAFGHEFDPRPITKSNVIFCTLFLFTFCFVFVGLFTKVFLG